MKMEKTVCSETSAFKTQTPGNYPKVAIQRSKHGEILKSRSTVVFYCTLQHILAVQIGRHQVDVGYTKGERPPITVLQSVKPYF